MEGLPADAALLVASCLTDERDAASLRQVNRFWRDIYTDSTLWSTLTARRFGADAPAAAASWAAAAARAQQPTPEQLFRMLAALKCPVNTLDRVIWLDSHHLQEVTEPGSTFSKAVKVHAVCWLEMSGRFHGVLPGRYRVAWRMRLQGQIVFDSGTLSVRPELPAALTAAPAAGASSGVEGQLAEHHEEEEQAAHSLGPTLHTDVNGVVLHDIFRQVGSSWFELLGDPFDVHQPCTVFTEFLATSGHWKRGIVFDCVRLVREPLPSGQGPGRQLGQRTAALRLQASRAVGWLAERVQGMLYH